MSTSRKRGNQDKSKTQVSRLLAYGPIVALREKALGTDVLGCTKGFVYLSMLFFWSQGTKGEVRKFVNNTLGSRKET